ncbi:hypothetical protein KPL70_009264 [Citrus sinensis]|nr:hypothetical protein KPL70_009264 [Citrus sinensis]
MGDYNLIERLRERVSSCFHFSPSKATAIQISQTRLSAPRLSHNVMGTHCCHVLAEQDEFASWFPSQDMKSFEVYPRPRVRIKEQQQEEEKAENHFSPPNDKGSILFLRVLESLALPDSSSTKENQSGSPPSIARIKKACNSASKDISKDIKQNHKVRSVMRPRAVLSSPDNDRLIGNGNKFDNKRCSSSTKKLILDRQNKMPAKTTPIKAVTPPVTVSFGARSGLARTKSFKGESES